MGKMKIKTDLHCHTLASVHAYSTIKEMVDSAVEKGLELIALTDHGVGMDPHMPFAFFCNYKEIPDYISGVRVLCGCEVNILDNKGTLDMPEELLKSMDFVGVSVHDGIHEGMDEDHTECYLKLLEKPYVDMLCHSGNPRAEYDIDTVLKRAGELHKLIEINAHTFSVRPANVKNCRKIAERAKALGVGIAVNSDAHFYTTVNQIEPALAMLREIDFPEELIMNRSYAALKDYLKDRRTI